MNRIFAIARSRAGCLLAVSVALVGAVAPTSATTLDDARELHRAGRLDEALAAYREVVEGSRESDPPSAAIAYNNACVLLNGQGRYAEAVAECRAGLELARTIDDERRLARMLNNLGLALINVGDLDEAESRYREALVINEARDDVASQLINWANLGVVATEAGRYADALACHDRVQQLAEAHPDEPWAAEQRRVALINRAVVLERVGAYREALELYGEVLAEEDELDARRQANLAVNVGVVYRNLGDPVRAAEAFDAAQETFSELGDRAGLANAVLNEALALHLNLDRPQQAEQAYRRALTLTRESGNRTEEIRVLCALGRLLFEQGRLDEAGAEYDACRVAAVEAESSEGRWLAAEGLARVAGARGDPDRALVDLEQALDEIESERVRLDRDDLREIFLGERRSIYRAAVDLMMRADAGPSSQQRAERAFDVVQRAKARSLLDALGRGGPGTRPRTASEIASQVGDDLLLAYYFGEERLHGWVVQDGTVRSFDAGPAELRRRQVTEIHAAFERGETPPVETIRDLSRGLLAGVDPSIVLPARTWIAPDGRLQFLPFERLTLDDDGRYLVEATTTAYLPSASALGLVHEHRERVAIDAVALGAPALPSGDERFPTPAELLVRRYALADLPGARAELDMIRETLGGTVELRVGEDATREELERLLREPPRVLHLATHTVVGDRADRGTAIVLAPGDASDGLLLPADIAALDGAAELTVLSSCRSALGPAEGGDALAFLTGAFLASGSSEVVAALWDVDDDATRVFMEQFYARLADGRSAARALRETKLAMIHDERWRDRNVWPAFVLVGDGGPVFAGARWRRLALVGFVVAFVLVLVAVSLWRRNPRRRPT